MAQASRGIPDDILREIVSDPDFQKLDEEGQDQALSRFAQESFGQVQPSENVFTRALGSIGRQAGSMLDLPQQEQASSTPFEAGLSAVGKFRNPLHGPSLESSRAPETAFGELGSDIMNIQDPVARGVTSTALNIIPQALVGGVKGFKPAVKLSRSIIKPSAVYGEALSKPGKVNFLEIIHKYSDDPTVSKVLNRSKVVKKYGGSSLGEGGAVSERLSNLTPKQSQDLINDVKLGKDALVSGKRIKPNEVKLSEFFSELSKAQNAGVEGIEGSKKLFGFSKNIGRVAKSTVGKVAAGSLFGAGAKTAYDVLK